MGSVIVTPLAVSTPSLFMNGVGFDGVRAGIVNAQFFTANGTWTKPSGLTGNELVFVMMWGGGGGGSANGTTQQAGGGGGSCSIGMFPVNTVTDTVAVTVGLPGAAGTGGVQGGTGSNSTFVVNTSVTFRAHGGSGGRANGTLQVAGGGGGLFSPGLTTGVGGAPLGGAHAASGNSTFGGGGGGQGSGAASAGISIFGGGGGNWGGTNFGGASIYGGGGGGGAVGGTSIFGGNGGTNTTPAQAPGGGGSANNTTPAAAARGEVRVWVIA